MEQTAQNAKDAKEQAAKFQLAAMPVQQMQEIYNYMCQKPFAEVAKMMPYFSNIKLANENSPASPVPTDQKNVTPIKNGA